MHSEKPSGPDPKAWCAAEPELGAPLRVALRDREVVAVRDREVVVVLDREVLAAVVGAAVEVEVVVLLTDATVGLFELPPHPATRIPLASAATASRRVRGCGSAASR